MRCNDVNRIQTPERFLNKRFCQDTKANLEEKLLMMREHNMHYKFLEAKSQSSPEEHFLALSQKRAGLALGCAQGKLTGSTHGD